MKPLILLAALSLLSAAPAKTESEIKLKRVGAKEVQPLKIEAGKTAAFVFVTHDCPISNKYAGEIERLHKQFNPSLPVYLVYTDIEMTEKEARQHLKSFKLSVPALMDTRHELALKLGITITPEAALVSSSGELLYRGRIDDRYNDLNKGRSQPKVKDLENAIRQTLAGETVSVPRTEAVGCDLQALPEQKEEAKR